MCVLSSSPWSPLKRRSTLMRLHGAIYEKARLHIRRRENLKSHTPSMLFSVLSWFSQSAVRSFNTTWLSVSSIYLNAAKPPLHKIVTQPVKELPAFYEARWFSVPYRKTQDLNVLTTKHQASFQQVCIPTILMLSWLSHLRGTDCAWG
jgi:hypothetical protein